MFVIEFLRRVIESASDHGEVVLVVVVGMILATFTTVQVVSMLREHLNRVDRFMAQMGVVLVRLSKRNIAIYASAQTADRIAEIEAQAEAVRIRLFSKMAGGVGVEVERELGQLEMLQQQAEEAVRQMRAEQSAAKEEVGESELPVAQAVAEAMAEFNGSETT